MALLQAHRESFIATSRPNDSYFGQFSGYKEKLYKKNIIYPFLYPRLTLPFNTFNFFFNRSSSIYLGF